MIGAIDDSIAECARNRTVPLAPPEEAAVDAADAAPAADPDELELDELPHPEAMSAKAIRSANAADARKRK
jgi:hypothetical protein